MRRFFVSNKPTYQLCAIISLLTDATNRIRQYIYDQITHDDADNYDCFANRVYCLTNLTTDISVLTAKSPILIDLQTFARGTRDYGYIHIMHMNMNMDNVFTCSQWGKYRNKLPTLFSPLLIVRLINKMLFIKMMIAD